MKSTLRDVVLWSYTDSYLVYSLSAHELRCASVAEANLVSISYAAIG
jgi:hypothetical protein